jgi:CheY-like chemotaxis protein
MPGMNGFELSAEIRKDPRFTDTPIIFLTGHTESSYVFKALTTDIQDFIIKPSTSEAILAKVDKYLA